jgi:hypothetical protein
MSKVATMNVSASLVGDGETLTYTQANAQNLTAPNPFGANLLPGNNTIAMPTTGTFTAAILYPLSTSTNVKIIKGAVNDTGIGGWTSTPMVVPAAPSSTFVINSVGSESINIVLV